MVEGKGFSSDEEIKRSNPEFRIQNLDLTLQEGVLAFAMIMERNNATTDYILVDNGKALSTIAKEQIPLLIEKYQHDPKKYLAIGRNNILAIMQDTNMSKEMRKERVKCYVDAFLSLQIKLDHLAFPPSDEVKEGTPEYIPDGFSDMGTHDETDVVKRRWEKIRVDKKKIFEQSKDFIYEIFSHDYKNMSLEEIKECAINEVTYFICRNMPYNLQGKKIYDYVDRKSVPLDKIFEHKLAVCRHQALYPQVLLQTFGIESYLLNCLMYDSSTDKTPNIGGHVANLVKKYNKWFLMDVTNPDLDDSNSTWEFMFPLNEEKINIGNDSNRRHTWSIKRKSFPKELTYISRNDMCYYRIRSNE